MTKRFATVVAAFFAFSIGAAQANAAATAVEFYNADLEAYFVTADQAEISSLEQGAPPGWQKTGYAFSVSSVPALGYLPVCRFFSASFAPKSSHFYTPYATECSTLKAGSVWTYESIAFYLSLPFDNGMCASGQTALYRLYNNGSTGAPNHRYTSSRPIVSAMKVKGWTVEGDASTEVFACGPAAPSGSNASVRLTSSVNSRPYDISVVVPADYDQDSAPLPVIYALDGQIRVRYFDTTIKETGNRVILVRISDMSARVIDDQLPGAFAFHQFITKDLFAFIDANYRTDPTKRVLSGISLAGEFVILSLYLDTPDKWHFSHYHVVDWGANGSLTEEVLTAEQRIYDAMVGRSFPVTMIFARGSSVFSPTTKVLHDMFAARKYPAFRLYDWAYPTGHVETDTPALIDLLKLLCGASQCRGLEH